VPIGRHTGLNGSLPTAPSVTAALIALLLAAGCVARPQMPRPASAAPFGRNVSLIYVSGIGGFGDKDSGFVRGLRAGGYVGNAEVVDWTGQLGPIAALWAHVRQQAEAHRIAQRIGKIRSESPQAPIVLVGHSAGTAVAVGALEDLPPGVSVDELVLLAPALSRTYDLTAALRHVRGCADVFNSDRDTLVLAFGTLLFGTADGVHGEAAGHGGFVRPPGAGHDAYSRLHAHVYSRDRRRAGDDGGHEGILTSGVAAAVIAPLLPGHKLHQEPVAQSDARELP
jgi:pimeloyl-ACP methyl ester carboxylesterase